ncbi:unnamed protein product [Clonostachys byssicola]|uniref:Sulfate transporter family protein n=1 Tax=Clonostachys byssicola TaxID=160290 RepID=A0A9N9TWB4_9HYPO|nr:unnamed protein product [Clonostachys byssicola]
MSSPMTSFSPWRARRASSASTATDPNHHHQPFDTSSAINAPSDGPVASSFRLSSSIGSGPGQREPVRSFIHGSVRENLAPIDSAQIARTVRQDTAELASYYLSGGQSKRSPSFLHRSLFEPPEDESAETNTHDSNAIPEVSEPPSPEDNDGDNSSEGPSALANLLRKSPPQSLTSEGASTIQPSDRTVRETETDGEISEAAPPRTRRQPSVTGNETERTPLLRRQTTGGTHQVDVEGQTNQIGGSWLRKLFGSTTGPTPTTAQGYVEVESKASFSWKSIAQHAVIAPASCLPAVCVGLLLNILDALSYGMVLFPLGKAIFSQLGSAGISIFYVSTIVSQITFSSGSIFRGAVGSELIEVVPFFHNMAQKITDVVGSDDPDAVIATTITAYCLSSMMTGLVFFLIGQFKFGFMVGFIPRHILIGCIGGVGWFLLATGFEVSARLEGSVQYNLDTLHRLFQADTVLLWLFPLTLAIVLFCCQARGVSKYFLPIYILSIPMVFYFFVGSLDALDIDALRDDGWIFEGPPSGEPWWYFYTLFKFHLIRWDALAETIPAMFALTFFGILHVPINVPALALQTGEDNADLDTELKLHGYSNFISGCLGGIQNYLVYANTVFFMRSGGDSRLAGYMLAALTFGVMVIGPSLIGFIPVMMVGTLIFDLGFELLIEAVWLPRKKMKLSEYLTVIVIVLVMGIYDFVVGIGVGILLAFVTMILQTSRVSAIRGSYTGDIVTSTVRRNPSQHHYLKNVGGQIYIMKLTGYLFFGTIVSVEEKIRALLDNNAFAKKPIKFLILDLWHVTGLDYSAGEVFNTISRLLNKKEVVFVLSGVDPDGQLGRNLRAVGLGSNDIEVLMLLDLNSALESCENELLKTLYARQEEINSSKRTATASLDVPDAKKPKSSSLSSFNPPFNSPRRTHLVEAASDALQSLEVQRPKKWQSFKEPLRLMMQIFQGLSDKNEDVWFAATNYFKRREYPAGTVLFRRGEEADGFYLVERGILRVEYDLPQGWLCESIMAGTTCGELPFFSETARTATATVEQDCVVWLMDRDYWDQVQREQPEVARELLTVSLKLTSERMSAITSYTMTIAG